MPFHINHPAPIYAAFPNKSEFQPDVSMPPAEARRLRAGSTDRRGVTPTAAGVAVALTPPLLAADESHGSNWGLPRPTHHLSAPAPVDRFTTGRNPGGEPWRAITDSGPISGSV